MNSLIPSRKAVGLVCALLFALAAASAQTVVTLTTNSVSPWIVPAGVTSITVQMWGGGGGGGGQLFASKGNGGGGGGGGGGYTIATISVTPGSSLPFTVGAAGSAGEGKNPGPSNGGNGGDTTFQNVSTAGGGQGGGDTTTAGAGGTAGNGGNGGTFNGGNGAAGTGTYSGGGGGSAGTNEIGNSAVETTGGSPVPGGGGGANGSTTKANGTDGSFPGGGGSAAMETSGTGGNPGGNGAAGQIVITYSAPVASQLQVVLPGQTGGAGPVTGSPTAVAAGQSLSVTIYAVDSAGYVDPTATPTLNFSSSDGAANLPANGSTVLVNGQATVNVTFNTVGSQTVTASDAASVLTANTSSSVSVQSLSIPVVKVPPSPSAITYGQSLSASTLTGGSCTNSSGVPVAGTFAYVNPSLAPNAGITNVSVSFTPSSSSIYATIYFNLNVTVNQATPVVQTPPSASPIIFGYSLSQSTLSGGVCVNNSAVPVPGTFAFTSPNTTPPVGTANQSVTFTPTDSIDYASFAFNVSVTVNAFTEETLSTNSVSPWVVPSGVTSITVQMWGGGGGGGGQFFSASGSGGAGGGGGGGYTIATISVTPGTSIPFGVGAAGTPGEGKNPGPSNGGNGGDTTFQGVTTAGGGVGGGDATTAGAGGTGGTGGIGGDFDGGAGAAGSGTYSGGGGSGAGTNELGNSASTTTGGAAVSGGGAGANGSTSKAMGAAGTFPGGGGSGDMETGGTGGDPGGAGAAGEIIISVAGGSSTPPQPDITSVHVSGPNLIINGNNGATGTYYVLASTNVGLPFASWLPVSTNVLSASGSFSITATNVVTPGPGRTFFILQTQ